MTEPRKKPRARNAAPGQQPAPSAPPAAKRKIGRPTLYRPEMAALAGVLSRYGAIDEEIARELGVNIKSVRRWRAEYPEFGDALKNGKDPCDDRVERSLYHRAVGYRRKVTKPFMPAGSSTPVLVTYTEEVPPDVTAMIFWLKNRRPDAWRDVRKFEHGAAGEFDGLSDAELSRIVEAGRAVIAGAKPTGSGMH